MPTEPPAPPLRGRPAAVAALAAGQSTHTAAAAAHVSRRTVQRWQADPAFDAEVRAMRARVLADTVGALTTGAAEAVQALRAALTDDDGRNRVQAARTLLDALLPLREHVDLEERITAIEEHEAKEARRRR